MSGTFDRRPELMILIAVLVAGLLGVFCVVGSCTAIVAAAGSFVDQGQPVEDYDDQFLEDILNGDEGYDDLDSILGDIYGDELTEGDVPSAMDIDVPELQDDLQAMINYDITVSMGLEDSQKVEVTNLTKDEVGTPELKNGEVLCQVSGKATVKNAEGETGTIDYTSYYYADDPTADKITWYIYAYDLGSYDLFPDGFKLKSGDPLGYRSFLLGSGTDNDLLRDRGRDATDA